MYLLLVVIFCGCIVGVLHTYVLYPWWLRLTTPRPRVQNDAVFVDDADLPTVDIIFAAYNEEAVIEDKLRTMLASDYPMDRLRIIVGSDASTDATNAIVERYVASHPDHVQLVPFPGRTGKAGIINALAARSTAQALVLTDANVMFTPGTVRSMVRHFNHPRVRMVAGNIIKVSSSDDGISRQEKTYIRRENDVKLLESIRWNAVMGVEGGCYAIRREDYAPVPPTFFMDDFYITMHVLEAGGWVLFEPEAICYEDVPSSGAEEYKRKVRISVGNFQNLARFRALLFPFWKGIGFALLSHKVLRWFTPFLLIMALLAVAILAWMDARWVWLLAAAGMVSCMPIVDAGLHKFGFRVAPIRFMAHFLHMNVALLKGFGVFLRGAESNVWTPTKRNVS